VTGLPLRDGVSPIVWPVVCWLTGGAFCLLTDHSTLQIWVLLGFLGVGVIFAGITWAVQRGGRALVGAQTRRLDLQHETPETTRQRGMLSPADADDGALSETEGPDDQPRQ
jgi:hypothetical protein